MNKYQKFLVVAVVVAIFLVSFMASPSEAVLASGLTAIFTPTVNRTPPPTSTEGGNGVMFGTVVPGSVVCPSGGVSNPLGVTPDPLWEAMCGQCMPTATGYPTFEFPTQRPTMDFSVTQPPACQTVAPYGENCPTSVPVSTVTPVFTNTPATPVSTVVPVDDGYLVLDDAGFFSLEGQPAPLSQSYSC